MGYDIPAALGAAIARGGKQRIVCLAGDGSMMMNLQEMQTIRGLNLPVKIFIMNNQGYHSIRQTQANFFADNIVVGCGTDRDSVFPNFGKIARRLVFRSGAARIIMQPAAGDPGNFGERRPAMRPTDPRSGPALRTEAPCADSKAARWFPRRWKTWRPSSAAKNCAQTCSSRW